MSPYPKTTPRIDRPPTNLGLYLLPRGLGLLLGVEMIRLWPDLRYMYGAEGILNKELLSPQRENNLLAAHNIAIDLSHIIPGSINPIYLLASLYIAACIGLIIGWKDKICSLVLLLLHHSFFLANYSWSYGVDYLAQTGLFFGLLFGGAAALSPRLYNWTSWGKLLFGLQLTAVYLFAGLGKAMGATWWNGEAVWKALQQPFGQALMPIPESLHHYTLLWTVLGWATVILEIGYVLAWINARLRKIIIYCTIAMHLGILISMGLTHFAQLMIWYNCCVWILPYSKLAKPIINKLERHLHQDAGTLA